MGVRVAISWLLLSWWLAAPAAAQGRPGADAPAPSLSVATDPGVPHDALALTADPVAALFGVYGLRVESAVTAAHALLLSPRWTLRDGAHGLGLEVGYHLWPLGRGLAGLFLGPVLGAEVTAAGEARVTLRAGLEAGVQVVWEGLALGCGGGAEMIWSDESQAGARLVPRFVVAVGYAFM